MGLFNGRQPTQTPRRAEKRDAEHVCRKRSCKHTVITISENYLNKCNCTLETISKRQKTKEREKERSRKANPILQTKTPTLIPT